MKIMNMKIALTILSMALLTACSPVRVKMPTNYLLNNIPCDLPVRSSHPVILMINTPTTRPIYNTTQMAYRVRPFQIAYFSRNAWAETPSDMLQPLLIQVLQDTHYFRQIVSPPYIGPYDYALNTQILALYQDYECPRPCLVMSVRVQIHKMPSYKVIATRQYTFIQPFRPATPYAGVYAANHAAAKILRKIALFCVGWAERSQAQQTREGKKLDIKKRIP